MPHPKRKSMRNITTTDYDNHMMIGKSKYFLFANVGVAQSVMISAKHDPEIRYIGFY